VDWASFSKSITKLTNKIKQVFFLILLQCSSNYIQIRIWHSNDCSESIEWCRKYRKASHLKYFCLYQQMDSIHKISVLFWQIVPVDFIKDSIRNIFVLKQKYLLIFPILLLTAFRKFVLNNFTIWRNCSPATHLLNKLRIMLIAIPAIESVRWGCGD